MTSIGASLVCRLQGCLASHGLTCATTRCSFRIVINKATYLRLVSEVRSLRRTWTQYELVVHNCNNFVSKVAGSVGLRTPPCRLRY
jgi:hypothetical protein